MKYQKVHVEITNICNLQCSFCPEVVRGKKRIDLKLFSKIIEQVAPITEQVAFHLMGDPLVHPHLAELVEICHQHSVKIFFVTNGVLLREPQTDLLLHPAFRQVNFSLHSFHDNHPDKDPTEYLERIFYYTELAFDKRPDLYINYRLWNLQDPRGSVARNQDLLSRVAKRFHIDIPAATNVRSQKSYRVKNRLYLHFDTEFGWPDLNRPMLGTQGTCYGLSSHFGILVDGTVVPCCLDKEGAIPLGNIQERPLLEILGDSRARNILHGFRTHRLVEDLCQRCPYIERFHSPKMLDPYL